MLSYSDRLKALCRVLQQNHLDGFIIPCADAHQNEYVPASEERLAWLTGFTGSAGTAIVLMDKAALFVDGRYTLQAAQQVDPGLFSVYPLNEMGPSAWLVQKAPGTSRIGYDPWLHTPAEIQGYIKACQPAQIELVSCGGPNFIDVVWIDRPAPPQAPLVVYEEKYAGRSVANKLKDIEQDLKKHHAEAAVLTVLDSIAWLLNVRGNDIPFTPVALAYAIVLDQEKVSLFVDPLKVTDEVRQHLDSHVTIFPYTAFEQELKLYQNRRVLIDPITVPIFVKQCLQQVKAEIIEGADPCVLPKACKNEAELAGMRQAHVRDGVALVEFLAWLQETHSKQTLTEEAAAVKLLEYRQAQDFFQGPSFETISAAGAHGAIVHYHVTPESNASLTPLLLYLVDSGGQYRDGGTTDVTRTVALGPPPTEHQKEHYTRVLKGHIAIACALFPKGTTGSQLDVLARSPLWEVGLDYAHGTGHGVGSYLHVHEGPQRITSRGQDKYPLQPGMILSNEPGYYKEGAYGIRIESLVVVTPEPTLTTPERPFFAFETLTLVPFCRALILSSLLSEKEKQWVNTYHARVQKTLLPFLSKRAQQWLINETQEI